MSQKPVDWKIVSMGELYKEAVPEELERKLDQYISPLEARTLLDRINADTDRASTVLEERFNPILGHYDELEVLTYIVKRTGEIGRVS